jgi:C-terminal processing protease CtpA/Prc
MARMQPPISDVLKQRLQQQADGLMKPSPEGCPAVVEEHKSEWNYSRHKLPAKARFLVLVDNRCGSDCEMMVYTFAATPGTVIAGVNTYGVAQYIQPGYFLLPHSRVPFRIALGQSDFYGDGRSVDGYGLDVDVLLPGELDQSADRITRLAELLASQQKE